VLSVSKFVSDIVPQLHTGDVVLAAWPRASFSSQTVRMLHHSRFTHVGVVYRPSDCPDILKHRDRIFGKDVHPSRPLVAQFVNGGEMGHREKTEKGGLDLVDLQVYLEDHVDKFSHFPEGKDPSKFECGVVGVRMLLGATRDEQFYKNMEATVEKYWDVDFQRDPDKASQLDCCQCLPCCCCLRASNDDSDLICSEFAGQVYVRTGLVSDKFNPSEMVPPMWDSTRKLRLQDGVSLSKEYIFLGPTSLEERKAMGFQDISIRGPVSTKCGAGGFAGVDCSREVESRLPVDGNPSPKDGSRKVAPAPSQQEMS